MDVLEGVGVGELGWDGLGEVLKHDAVSRDKAHRAEEPHQRVGKIAPLFSLHTCSCTLILYAFI